jgi:hypothetical protein
LFQKHIFEIFRWGIIPKKFVDFFLALQNFKMTLNTLNIGFHIDLVRFVGD